MDASSRLAVTVSRGPTTVVVRLAGLLDETTAGTLDTVLTQLVPRPRGERHDRIVIDCSALESIDLRGVLSVVHAARAVRASHTVLEVRGASTRLLADAEEVRSRLA